MNHVKFFNSGKNRLSCVCTADNEQKIKAGVIFVHAADSNRLGPHRMFVELAEQLKSKGIASFRFDMRGCGDSDGLPDRDSLTQDIEDLLSAIQFFATKCNPPKIFLFAISRGARASLSALAEYNIPINGAFLLSTPCAGSIAAAKKFTDRLKEYLYKFSDTESLKKLFTGKVHWIQIFRTLTFALTSQKRYRRNIPDFASNHCRLFFIYGAKDPITADSISYYSQLCEKHKIPCTMTILT
jgi:pimeloyl-ACP methyl ester carboxylesterase